MGGKNIIIVGGQLFNKGAQAMVFITVNELKRRFQDKQIIVLSPKDYKRTTEDKAQYTFLLEKHAKLLVLLYLAGGLFKLIAIGLRVNKYDATRIDRILRETDIMIDISGYALGSVWETKKNLTYLFRIQVAKKYNIDTYIMPQSFGPFEYKKPIKIFLDAMIRKQLRYPKVIYAREKEGYNLLTQKFGLNNIKISPDMVLLNKTLDIGNVYRIAPKSSNSFCIKGTGNIGLITNMKIFNHGNKNEVLTLYKEIIKKLLGSEKKIYLLRHSYEDLEACQIVKNEFLNNEKVILVSDDLSSLEFSKLVGKFEFVIASRYHSIIHAYKNGVPCIAIGWATKYSELLELFKQEKYTFDVRTQIESSAIIRAVDAMIVNFKAESDTILNILLTIQKDDIFSILEEKR